MNPFNITKPLTVQQYLKHAYPDATKKDVMFLTNWRKAISSKMPFIGWRSITNVSEKANLMAMSMKYAKYLMMWAEYQEELIPVEGSASHDDVNPFNDNHHGE